MTNQINFTIRSLEDIPFATDGRDLYRDSRCSHLYLYVTKTHKTFYYIRKVNGKTLQEKIGTTEDFTIQKARERVAEMNAKIADKIDVREEKNEKKKQMTFLELFQQYKADKASSKRTILEDERKVYKNLELFHSFKIADVTYDKVRQLHKHMEEVPYVANRVLALISAIYNYAIHELRLKVENPCKGIKKYKEHARQRILNLEELKRFTDTLVKWSSISVKSMYSDIFLVMLYTGQRKGNVLSMKFKAIDFEAMTWTLYPKETKNKEQMTVALHDEAFNILKRRHELLGENSEYVFPSPINHNMPVVEPKRQWHHLLQEAQLENLTIHDIRRSFGAYLLMSCKDLRTVQESLGHKDISTTAKVYTPILLENKRKSINNIFKNPESESK